MTSLTKQPSQAGEKLLRFDVLRGIAIISVFYYHYLMNFSQELSYKAETGVLDTAGQPFSRFFYTFFPGSYGDSGVMLFFVISGFLIHYSFLKSGRPRLEFRAYIGRRFWRIYPPYLVAFLFFAFCTSHQPLSPEVIRQHAVSWISHLFLVHNFSAETFYDVNSSFWSLAVEWQFYLLYPVVLWLRGRMGMRKTTLLLLGLYPLYTLGMVLWCANPIANTIHVLSTFRLWGIWALGAWIAENYIDGKRTFSIPGGVIAALFIGFMAGKYFMNWLYLNHIGWGVLWAILVDKYIASADRNLSAWEKLLIPVGVCSYSFYLFHQPLLPLLYSYISVFGLSERIRMLHLLDSLPIFVLLFLLSHALYEWVELPSVAFGKKRQKKAAAVAA